MRDDLVYPELPTEYGNTNLPPGVTDAMIDAAAPDDSLECAACGHELGDHDSEDHLACMRPSCDCSCFEEGQP